MLKCVFQTRPYSTKRFGSLLSNIVTPEGRSAFNNRAQFDSHTISQDAKIRHGGLLQSINIEKADKFAVGEGAQNAFKTRIKKGDSGVLVAFVHLEPSESPRNDAEKIGQPWFLITHRSYQLRSHRGEVCFPGGRIEPGEDVHQAALRESFEEINLPTASVSVWGTLPSTLARNMKNRISPTVGSFSPKVLSLLEPRDSEVQSIFLVPMTDLLASRQYTTMKSPKFKYTLPLFFSRNNKLIGATKDAYLNPDNTVRIWGLTAVITHQVLRCLLPDEIYPSNLRDKTALQQSK